MTPRDRQLAAALELLEAEQAYLAAVHALELEDTEDNRIAKAHARERLDLAEGLAAQVASGVLVD